MPRPLTLIVLLACLLWQSMAIAHARVAPPGGGDLRHALLHWSGTAHQHDEDGSTTLDDSPASRCHLLGDAGCCSAAPPAEPPSFGCESPQEVPASCARQAAPPPYLDGLLRPPRA